MKLNMNGPYGSDNTVFLYISLNYYVWSYWLVGHGLARARVDHQPTQSANPVPLDIGPRMYCMCEKLSVSLPFQTADGRLYCRARARACVVWLM